MVIMLLAANLLSSSPSLAAGHCSPLSVPLRVKVTIDARQWNGAKPVIKQLVEKTWSPAGLRIQWVDGDRSDFWIAAISGMATTMDGGALGMVQFDGDRPAPLARVSIDAARSWARRYRARLFHTPVRTIFGRFEDTELIHHVMGYAAAHEIGHFVLATKSHAPAGVMRASYEHPQLIFNAAMWQLDSRNAATLRQRLANCEDRQ